MDLLVVGASGLLGSNVVVEGLDRGWAVRGTYHSNEPDLDVPLSAFDLESHGDFDEVLGQHEPDLVVNCAAMTGVDACEDVPERAFVVNGAAPGAMADRCADAGVDFVHVSTDYVFDGSDRCPYVETVAPNPVQVYGESKLAGERAVREAMPSALVPRLSFVWGIHRGTGDLSGFPAWMRGRIVADESVPLFTDQWVTPSRAGQVAGVLFDLVECGERGVYNVACASCVTPFAFGEQLVERFGTGSERLVAGSMAAVDRPAQRPSYTCLDVGKLESALDRSQPTLHEDVEAVVSPLG